MQQVREPESDELFEIANLFPRTTGLPMTVWVSPRGNTRHEVRVKLNMSPGDQMTVSNTAVVGVRPTPHVIAGQLSPDDQRAVFAWVSLNSAALIAYWEGRIDTIRTGPAAAAPFGAARRAFRPVALPRSLTPQARRACAARRNRPTRTTRGFLVVPSSR
jgi:hypothetical protein